MARSCCVRPGIGDVRAQYRFLAPALVAAGYRVVLMDLRGLGDSTTGFASYSSDAVGDDMVALLRRTRRRARDDHRQFGERGIRRVGRGDDTGRRFEHRADRTVRARDETGVVSARVVERGVSRILGAPGWMAYYSSLYPTHKPDDFDAYKAALSDSLDGRMQVVNAMLSASKAASEAKLGDVKARVLVVMGSRDPDFPDPADEALRVAKRLDGGVLMVEGAGHYPHAEMPEKTAPPIVAFLQHGAGATDGH